MSISPVHQATAYISSLVNYPQRCYEERIAPIVAYATETYDSLAGRGLQAMGFYAITRPGQRRDGVGPQLHKLVLQAQAVGSKLMELGDDMDDTRVESTCPASPNYLDNASRLINLHNIPGQVSNLYEGLHKLFWAERRLSRIEGGANALVNSALLISASDSLSAIAKDWGYLDDTFRQGSPVFNAILTTLGSGVLILHGTKVQTTTEFCRDTSEALSTLQAQRRNPQYYTRMSLLGAVTKLSRLDQEKLKNELGLHPEITEDLHRARERLLDLSDRRIVSAATNLVDRVQKGVDQKNLHHRLELLACLASTSASFVELCCSQNEASRFLLAAASTALLAGNISDLYVNAFHSRRIR